MPVPEVTFFMIVTPREAVISDFCIRSFGLLRGLDFQLVVWSNYLLPEQKAYYFPRWEALPWVDLRRNDHHEANLPRIRERLKVEKRMAGPFEYPEPIWDAELWKIESPFIGTVDSDFEILHPRFAFFILDQLKRRPTLVAHSTDYSETAVVYESYTRERIILNERNMAYFCLYKRAAFERSRISFGYHQEILNSSTSVKRNAWDSGAYFQKSLRDLGYELDSLHGRYRTDYIHYGAFANNTTVTRANVRSFRAIALLEHRLHPRLGSLLRRVRKRLAPRLENNRYEWSREAPINW